MKDNTARELAKKALDAATVAQCRADRAYRDSPTYRESLGFSLYVRDYQLDAVKADAKRAQFTADTVKGQIGRMAAQMAELQRRIEELEGKKKPKVCKHCGQEKV